MKQYKNHFLVILAIYFLIILTMSLSPYVIVSGEENSLSHILFFASLISTNLIVPFALRYNLLDISIIQNHHVSR